MPELQQPPSRDPHSPRIAAQGRQRAGGLSACDAYWQRSNRSGNRGLRSPEAAQAGRKRGEARAEDGEAGDCSGERGKGGWGGGSSATAKARRVAERRRGGGE